MNGFARMRCSNIGNDDVVDFRQDPNALNVEVGGACDPSLFKRLNETFPTFDNFVEEMSVLMDSQRIPNMHIVWVLWWFANQTEHARVKFHNKQELLALEKQEYGFVAKRTLTISSGTRNVYNIFFSPCATVQELWKQCQEQFDHETEECYFLIRPETNPLGKWLGEIISTHVTEISKDYHCQHYPGIAHRGADYKVLVSTKVPQLSCLTLTGIVNVVVEIEIAATDISFTSNVRCSAVEGIHNAFHCSGSARAKMVEACMYDFVNKFPMNEWLEKQGQYRLFLQNVGRLSIKSIGKETAVLATTLDCTTVLECARKHFLEPHLDMLSILRTERWELAQLQKYATENWNLSCAGKTREEIVSSLEYIFNSTEWLKIIPH